MLQEEAAEKQLRAKDPSGERRQESSLCQETFSKTEQMKIKLFGLGVV
jgi:hypothetical protein